MSWAERAEELAHDVTETGRGVAAIHAACWRARVDPDVTAGLAGAAVALWAPTTCLYSAQRPMPDDRTLVTATEDHEMTVAEQGAEAQRQRASCASALDSACEAHRKAVELLHAAQNGKANVQVERVKADISELEHLIADCEVALEIYGAVTGRLAYAHRCLQRVPDDLAGTYEAAYRLLRFGVQLPADGDFLTGTPATPDHNQHAIAR